jgi:hypothetical protein
MIINHFSLFSLFWKKNEAYEITLLSCILLRFLGGKVRPARKAHNLTATCEPIV